MNAELDAIDTTDATLTKLAALADLLAGQRLDYVPSQSVHVIAHMMGDMLDALKDSVGAERAARGEA